MSAAWVITLVLIVLIAAVLGHEVEAEVKRQRERRERPLPPRRHYRPAPSPLRGRMR